MVQEKVKKYQFSDIRMAIAQSFLNKRNWEGFCSNESRRNQARTHKCQGRT
jgi:hypothetical protein